MKKFVIENIKTIKNEKNINKEVACTRFVYKNYKRRSVLDLRGLLNHIKILSKYRKYFKNRKNKEKYIDLLKNHFKDLKKYEANERKKYKKYNKYNKYGTFNRYIIYSNYYDYKNNNYYHNKKHHKNRNKNYYNDYRNNFNYKNNYYNKNRYFKKRGPQLYYKFTFFKYKLLKKLKFNQKEKISFKHLKKINERTMNKINKQKCRYFKNKKTFGKLVRRGKVKIFKIKYNFKNYNKILDYLVKKKDPRLHNKIVRKVKKYLKEQKIKRLNRMKLIAKTLNKTKQNKTKNLKSNKMKNIKYKNINKHKIKAKILIIKKRKKLKLKLRKINFKKLFLNEQLSFVGSMLALTDDDTFWKLIKHKRLKHLWFLRGKGPVFKGYSSLVEVNRPLFSTSNNYNFYTKLLQHTNFKFPLIEQLKRKNLISKKLLYIKKLRTLKYFKPKVKFTQINTIDILKNLILEKINKQIVPAEGPLMRVFGKYNEVYNSSFKILFRWLAMSKKLSKLTEKSEKHINYFKKPHIHATNLLTIRLDEELQNILEKISYENRKTFWKKKWYETKKMRKLNSVFNLFRTFKKRHSIQIRKKDLFKIKHQFNTTIIPENYGKQIINKNFKMEEYNSNSTQNYLLYFEKQLANIVVKSKYAPTINSAIHLIRYGNVFINNKKCVNPFTQTKLLDIVRILNIQSYIRYSLMFFGFRLKMKKYNQHLQFLERNSRILSTSLVHIPSVKQYLNSNSLHYKQKAVYKALPLISKLF